MASRAIESGLTMFTMTEIAAGKITMGSFMGVDSVRLINYFRFCFFDKFIQIMAFLAEKVSIGSYIRFFCLVTLFAAQFCFLMMRFYLLDLILGKGSSAKDQAEGDKNKKENSSGIVILHKKFTLDSEIKKLP